MTKPEMTVKMQVPTVKMQTVKRRSAVECGGMSP
jgi:hypothetical protein